MRHAGINPIGSFAISAETVSARGHNDVRSTSCGRKIKNYETNPISLMATAIILLARSSKVTEFETRFIRQFHQRASPKRLLMRRHRTIESLNKMAAPAVSERDRCA